MQVISPLYFLLLIAIPFFLLFSLKSYHKMRKWLAAFGGIRIKTVRNIGRIVVLSVLLLLATLSLVRISVEYERMVSQRKGIDIVIGLDTSRSMLAEDTVIPDQTVFLNKEYPNRLNRGKLEALKLINNLNGERVGMFFFAYRGTRIVELTEDYNLCNYMLMNSESTDLAFTGSNLDYALRTGISMFRSDSKYKVMVLISDGELEDPSQIELVVSEARNASANKVIIYTVGVGGGSDVLIPKRTDAGVEWFEDSKGGILKTKMNEDVLRKIATMTNGTYFHAKDKVAAERIVNDILEKVKNVQTLKRPIKKRSDLSPMFLAALLFTWLGWEALLLVIDTKRAK